VDGGIATINGSKMLRVTVFRIRIRFLRIRIHGFFLNPVVVTNYCAHLSVIL